MHIDAPVERAFDYAKDPRRFMDAWGEDLRQHTAVGEVHLAPDGGVGTTPRIGRPRPRTRVHLAPDGGVGTTATLMGRIFFTFHGEWTMKREEFVPNERIVDRRSWPEHLDVRARRSRGYDPVAGMGVGDEPAARE